MIERKRFLELCQINSVLSKKEKVKYKDVEYYPKSLIIWYNEKGETQNSGFLIECKSNSGMQADLKQIREVKK